MDKTSRRPAVPLLLQGKSGTPGLRNYRTEDLFADSNRVLIDHNGTAYLLQITSQGKLLLTK